LSSVFVHVGVADVSRPYISRLDLHESGVLQSIDLRHLLGGLVFLNWYVALRGMVHFHARNLATLNVDSRGVFAVLIDYMMAVGFDFVANQIFSVVVFGLRRLDLVVTAPFVRFALSHALVRF